MLFTVTKNQLDRESAFLIEKEAEINKLLNFTLVEISKKNTKVANKTSESFKKAAAQIRAWYRLLKKTCQSKNGSEKKLNYLMEHLNSWIAHMQTIRFDDKPLQRLHLSFLTRVTDGYVKYNRLELAKLKELYLNARGAKDNPATHDNQIFSLPENIDEFVSLEILYARFNHLSRLPTKLWQLKHLKELGLEGNMLRQLPDEIGELKSLEELGLDHNKLAQLPPGIGKLSKLRILGLDCNLIITLPETLSQLKQLEILGLNHNFIFETPEINSLDHLQILGLNNNLLTQYPRVASIARKNELIIGVENNPISHKLI